MNASVSEMLRGKKTLYRRRLTDGGGEERTFPAGLLCYPFLDQLDYIFIVASSDIQRGEEILIDYGPDAGVLISFKHSTTPGFCS